MGISGEDRILGQEEALARLILELINTDAKHVKTMTDLNEHEVAPLAAMETLADTCSVSVLKQFAANFCKYRVSRFRLGRSELVRVANAGNEGSEIRKKRGSIKDLFSGMG
jgi:hypothetical protein